MKNKKVSLTHIIYAGILILAVLLRVVNLNQVPLDNNEATHALCALDGNQTDCDGESRIYTFFTSIIFTILGRNNISARIIPILFGSLIVLLPLFAEPFLDRKTGVVMAFFLALDPILIQVTRSADAYIIGFVFILYVLVFILKQEYFKGFLVFLFGLLSGVSFWVGLIILGISFGLSQVFVQDKKKNEPDEKKPLVCPFRSLQKNKSDLLLVFILWILISTRFLNDPSGFLAPLNSLAALFSSMSSKAATLPLSPKMKTIGLSFYSIFGIILCVMALIKKSYPAMKNALFVLVWMGTAFFFFLLPSSSFFDVVWFILPMWFLASGEVVRLGEMVIRERKQILIPTLIGIAVLVFLSLEVVRLNYLISVGLNVYTNLIVLVVPIILFLIVIILFGYGWSKKLALCVSAALFLVCGLFGLVRNANRAANLTGTIEHEIVRKGYFLHNADVLVDEIEQYRISHGAFPQDVHIGISSQDQSESMQWLLQDYSVEKVSVVSESNAADYDIFILEQDGEQMLSGFYSQDLALKSNIRLFNEDNSGFIPAEILEWLLYRGGTLDLKSYALWFRL